jgi:hypothetical protein
MVLQGSKIYGKRRKVFVCRVLRIAMGMVERSEGCVGSFG